MHDIGTSEWHIERFGNAGLELAEAVIRALTAAHADALAAHDAAGMTHHDTYGNTIKVRMHEHLEAQVADMPAVAFRKPAEGGRFGLVIVKGTAVALLPIRIGRDPMTTHTNMRLQTPVSEIRATLLGLGPTSGDRQLTLDQGLLDSDELEAQFAEIEELERELGRMGQVVVVAFGSSPTAGIWDLGWGDLQISDAGKGEVVWTHWERLAPRGAQGGDAQLDLVKPPSDLPDVARFDDDAEDAEFDLSPRRDFEIPAKSSVSDVAEDRSS